MPLKDLIEKQYGSSDKFNKKPKKKTHTFKTSRAQKHHTETVLSAFQSEIKESTEINNI